jgi:hypothetical protein
MTTTEREIILLDVLGGSCRVAVPARLVAPQ